MKKTTNKKTDNQGKKGEKSNERFPGYKPYPPSEDMVNRGKRVEGDIEDLLENNQVNSVKVNAVNVDSMKDKKDKTTLKDNTQKKNDLASEGNKPFEEDEELKNRVMPVDFAGSDLDIPGSELDDDNEAIGSEDEENNSYSLGGDAHDRD